MELTTLTTLKSAYFADKNLPSFFEACTFIIALHQQIYNTMKAFIIITFNFPTADVTFMCLIKTIH
jgi:hypothetical protein